MAPATMSMIWTRSESLGNAAIMDFIWPHAPFLGTAMTDDGGGQDVLGLFHGTVFPPKINSTRQSVGLSIAYHACLGLQPVAS